MILSMTGFGRGTAVRNGREITVELRSVNSRYFEYLFYGIYFGSGIFLLYRSYYRYAFGSGGIDG